MKNLRNLTSYIIVLFLLTNASCKVKNIMIYEQPYYFLTTDVEMYMANQNQDTINVTSCNINFDCNNAMASDILKSKIELIKKSNETYLLKVVNIDFNKNNHQGYWIVKRIDKNKVIQYNLITQLINDLESADKIYSSAIADKDVFGYTFYSKNYLNELQHLPNISTIEQVHKILELTQSEKFKKIAISQAKSGTTDIYGAGFAGEVLTSSCIELGFNPVGAGRKIDSIVRFNKAYFNQSIR
ncbi:hypothetical protein [Edaphocola flava]|uniref:hypothetical protein n=1 Tax=Edaphocola flava TaxID=2499629 RepID=UPI00100BD0B7|nr:hypothetical protein [Edaphocola flava]